MPVSTANVKRCCDEYANAPLLLLLAEPFAIALCCSHKAVREMPWFADGIAIAGYEITFPSPGVCSGRSGSIRRRPEIKMTAAVSPR
jgi:hypothetical protein